MSGWKGTPGPWEAAEVGGYADFDGLSRVIIGDDMRLAVVQRSKVEDGEADANADGMAAVPLLVEAMLQARLLIGEGGQKAELPALTRECNLNQAWHLLDGALRAAKVLS